MCFHYFFSLIYRILKPQNVRMQPVMLKQTVYKAPGQANGKIIESTAAGAWQNGVQPLSNDAGHSFATALQHVVGNNANVKFLAYNNAPPGVPSIKTKSNSKGVIILATNADSAAWIVHTVPGFPTAKTAYSWPAAENARGHLLICLTISESQINAIAASLLLVQPMVHYNDIPETETAGMPYFNKLAEGKIPTLPPFTSRRSIHTENAGGPVAVHIYSKSESSKYEIYKKVLVKVLKKTIKVWSKRDNILKGDCRGLQRHIRLIKSPAVVLDHNTNLEADVTNWAVSDPGNIFCHIDKPYFNQQWQFALKIMIYLLDLMQLLHNLKIVHNKILLLNGINICVLKWHDINSGINLFNYQEKMLKFSELLALLLFVRAIVYKAPGQDTGKIIFATAAGSWDNGASAFTNNAGHSFAKALEHVVGDHNNIKFLAYNNVPPGVPNIKTKSNSKGVIILATNADSAAWIVHTVPGFPTAKTAYILKKTIKVWSRRDNILKGDCRGLQRHIRLIKSPAVIRDHNTNLEADVTNWAVSDPGNIFCHIDKPYFKNQTREPAMAVCIENNDIFARFNEIAAQLENCPQ
ncbi:Deoxyribonuclease-2-alpha [Trichinella papuae]|uniref:Deoxyribonuclease-2-alpha n=1 Tax=Trichinella papuae TaxID=268474 RepID=A0A0V1N1E5_9BILA|nr:Deoxyribonuclease-2-alpha [Trichinella papuae]